MMFFAILSLMGYVIWLVNIGGFNWQQTPFIALSICSCILYIFGVFGILEQGWGVAVTLGFALGAFAIYRNRSTFTLSGSNAIAFIIASSPFVFSFLAVKSDFLFTDWDEFSFWGASIKIISITNSLYDGKSALSDTFKAYPPLQQLIQYYFVYASGWGEAAVLRAHNIFIYSALLFSASTIIRKDVMMSALAFVSASTFIYFFKYDIGHVLVDQLLGVVFLASLCSAVSDEERDRRFILPITLFMLPLIKQIGLVFGLFSLGSMFVFYIFNQNEDFKTKAIYITKITVIGILLLIIAFKSWSFYMSSVGVTPVFSKSGPIDWASDVMQSKISYTIAELQRRVTNPLYFSFASYHFMPVTIFYTGVFLSIPIALLSKGRRLQTSAITVILPLMFIAYISFLVYCYIAFFSEYEARRLASFERYAGSFLLAWSAFMFFTLIDRSWCGFNHLTSLISIAAVAILIYGVTGYYKLDLQKIRPEVKKAILRKDVERLSNIVWPKLKTGDSVYFIAQDTKGLEKLAFSYEMQPYRVNNWCWTLGKKYYPDDVWTCDKNLYDVVKGYKYLAIYKADKQFWDLYSSHFSKIVESDGVGFYKINIDDKMKLTFTPVN
ncbi:hypothetical protein GJV04_08270 [Enterobacteriaceae bacterium RIT714]|nr:hypothetical protein [Enterobacteriaceae bacterium RIT714]